MTDLVVRAIKVLAAAGLLTIFAEPASAQIMIDPIGAYKPGYIASVHSAVEASIRAENPQLGSISEDEGNSESTTTSSFRYTASKARTRANLAQFVAKTRAVDPVQADTMQSFFATTDVIGTVGSEMRKVGLNPNDVADAYAVWWTLAWYAVQGRESQNDPETFAAVRQQAARAIAATGKFDGASDALRQEMAESLIVQAAMVDAANEVMRGDRDQRRALATAVNTGARKMGLDLNSMTLTPEGFRPRKRSDAGEAPGEVEGAEPRALAAASVTGVPANDTDDRTGTYALIATAGGAGLAGMFMMGRAVK